MLINNIIYNILYNLLLVLYLKIISSCFYLSIIEVIAYIQNVLFSTFSAFIEVSNRYNIQQIQHFFKNYKNCCKNDSKKS